MKQGTFEKEIFIKADAKTVFAIVSEFSQHHKVHPLIQKVERVADAPQGVKRYLITDSLQWGPFKFKIKYRADIVSMTEDTVHTEAYQAPQTYISNTTTVTPQADGVRLHETVTLKAPNLLFGYAFQQAEIAHEEMLKRIKAFAEQSGKS
ncbi:MAG: hypothetical protein HKUEN02_09820 [Anaerolineaceae bacterium]|nr:MAG: hypothetical protein HKUEN02_09820 [Anaerolineaceae bacterium]HRQ33451.1 SRPBCC family protein [Anaerolineales bacterium]